MIFYDVILKAGQMAFEFVQNCEVRRIKSCRQ